MRTKADQDERYGVMRARYRGFRRLAAKLGRPIEDEVENGVALGREKFADEEELGSGGGCGERNTTQTTDDRVEE